MPHGCLPAGLPVQGKTLQTLMLVLANRPPEGWAVSSLEGLAITAESEPIPIKCSLIVVPSNLIGQVGPCCLRRSLHETP
jgi:SNF2 family DNA or RNA helicase